MIDFEEKTRKNALTTKNPKSSRRNKENSQTTSKLNEYRELSAKREAFTNTIKALEDENELLQKRLTSGQERAEIVQNEINLLKERKEEIKYEMRVLYLDMLKSDYYLL